VIVLCESKMIYNNLLNFKKCPVVGDKYYTNNAVLADATL